MLKFVQTPMAKLAKKYRSTIDESIVRMLARAVNSRSLRTEDVKPRVENSISKYLLATDSEPEKITISSFIDSLHADDLCLILACERGDESAWNELVSQFDSTVKSAAYKYAKNREDAEDLASSIWAELHGLKTDADGNVKGKLGYYSGKGSLGGWLRAVTNQVAIDQFRKMKRIVQTEDDREFENLAHNSSLNSDEILMSKPANPEDEYAGFEAEKDLVKAIESAIMELEDQDRLLIRLYYFQNLKLKEIANTFGYHEATASRKVARIQENIRKSVERSLRNEHGWSQKEANSYLCESAEKLGMSIEKLFSVLVVGMLLQEIVRVSVQ